MNNSLLKTLVERNLIAVRTEIDATYRGRDIAGMPSVATTGTFLVLAITYNEDGSFVFACADTVAGHHRNIPGANIVAIDGMDPIRFAANFELTEDGEPMKVGKRRGRKPKALLAQMAREAAEAAA